jgi:hypothetical protein
MSAIRQPVDTGRRTRPMDDDFQEFWRPGVKPVSGGQERQAAGPAASI